MCVCLLACVSVIFVHTPFLACTHTHTQIHTFKLLKETWLYLFERRTIPISQAGAMIPHKTLPPLAWQMRHGTEVNWREHASRHWSQSWGLRLKPCSSSALGNKATRWINNLSPIKWNDKSTAQRGGGSGTYLRFPGCHGSHWGYFSTRFKYIASITGTI